MIQIQSHANTKQLLVCVKMTLMANFQTTGRGGEQKWFLDHHRLGPVAKNVGWFSQRVLGLTWRPRRMSFFVDQKPEEISKNDGNTI